MTGILKRQGRISLKKVKYEKRRGGREGKRER